MATSMQTLREMLREAEVPHFRRILEGHASPEWDWSPLQQDMLLQDKILRGSWRMLLEKGLPYHDLRRHNFLSRDLSYMDFRDLDLSYCDFRKANLRSTVFDRARLTRCRFGGADLTGAFFRGAHLHNADMRLAKLQDTNLSGATITRLHLDKGAVVIRDPIAPRRPRKAPPRRAALYLSPDQNITMMSSGGYDFTHAPRAWAQYYQDLARRLKEPGGHLLMLSGVPGSGKSHWYAHKYKGDHDVVVDATFITRTTRAPTLNFAKGMGWTVDLVQLVTDKNLCLSRNAARAGARRVPTAIIYSMADRLESATDAEGFDSVEYLDTEVAAK